MATLQEEATRLQFFEYIFGNSVGWLEIATKAYNSATFEQTYFRWPHQAQEMLAFVESRVAGYNIWFCTSLLSVPKRNKGNITECTCLWSDLDACSPDHLEDPKPNIVIQSSVGRYQAIWTLDKPVTPGLAEEYSRRIAYKYAEFGADIGCWNLGRLLRVPFTHNYKYGERKVELVTCINLPYPVKLFETLPEAAGAKLNVKMPMPPLKDLKESEILIEQYHLLLPDYFKGLHYDTPDDDADWSMLFWKELRLCFEAGMTVEEVFAIVLDSACNKFIRDDRPPQYTWNDVTRAYATHVQNAVNNIGDGWTLPSLVSQEEIPKNPTFVEDYVGWATAQTDAPAVYHQLSACIILSALLAKTVRIPTSMGTIRPNLWGMILADTTLTRKTTAMDMACDLLEEVLQDVVVATDGSVEGLLSALSMRNGEPSMFKRDEFTGLMEQMVRKDYMSGMLEMFTQLYDGKNIKRVLKKETINVSHPLFLMFTGGIKEKMQHVLNHEHIASGFIPRFIVVSAESDISKIRPLGRRQDSAVQGRNALLKTLRILKERYYDDIALKTEAGTTLMTAPEVNAELTDDAWILYNKLEHMLVEAGIRAELKEYMTPVLDRMAKSLLKLACILAAIRQIPEHSKIIVTVEDINRSAGMIQEWANHTVELVASVGMSATEKTLQRCLEYIRRNEGCMRSDLMRSFRLSAMEMEATQKTLEMRGLVNVEKKGKGFQFWTR